MDTPDRVLHHLHAVTRDAHLPFVSLDDSGAVMWWNPAAERLFGWGSDEVAGRSIAEVLAPARVRERYSRWLEGLRERFETTAPAIRPAQAQVVTRHGTELTVEVTMSALEVDGRVTYHAFMAERSDRRIVAQALTKELLATARADEYQRALRDYHDLMRHRIGNDPDPVTPQEGGLRPVPASRTDRLVENERFFRRVNEQVDALGQLSSHDELPLVCECSDSHCTEVVYLAREEYARLRGDDRYVVVARHDEPPVEHVVEQTPRYWVVKKELD